MGAESGTMSAKPRVQLLYNPAAGSHSMIRLNRLSSALQRAGAEVVATATSSGLPEIDTSASHVCIAGGDGTLRHAAIALARSEHRAAASAYPAGTINLLAREVGNPADPEKFAARMLGNGEIRKHFAASLNETLFLVCASAGPDVAAMQRLSPGLKRRIGRLAYVTALIGVLRRWPRPRIRLTANGESMECEAVYVAKGRFYAGPWSFAPAARLDQPWLHVVALERAGRRQFLRFALDLALGRDPALRRGVRSFKCEALELMSDSPVAVQADGDVITRLPVRIAIDPHPILFR
jgi:diacylglycerol kinase (ATP)